MGRAGTAEIKGPQKEPVVVAEVAPLPVMVAVEAVAPLPTMAVAAAVTVAPLPMMVVAMVVREVEVVEVAAEVVAAAAIAPIHPSLVTLRPMLTKPSPRRRN